MVDQGMLTGIIEADTIEEIETDIEEIGTEDPLLQIQGLDLHQEITEENETGSVISRGEKV